MKVVRDSSWRPKTHTDMTRLLPERWIVTSIINVEITGGKVMTVIRVRHGASGPVMHFEKRRFLSRFKEVSNER